MFSECREGPLRDLPRLGPHLLGLVSVFLLAVVMLWYAVTDGFTIGLESDLCEQDAKTLAAIRAAIAKDASAFRPAIGIQVRWDYGQGAYCVRSLTVHAEDSDRALPLISRFAALQEFHLAGASSNELERVSAAHRGLIVTNKSTGLRGGC